MARTVRKRFEANPKDLLAAGPWDVGETQGVGVGSGRSRSG